MPRLSKMLSEFLIPSGASSPEQGSLPHPHKCHKCWVLFPIVADFSCRYYMMPWLQRCRTNPVTAAYELFLGLIFFDVIFVPEE